MKKINFTLTGIIIAFLAIAVVVGFVYHTGRQRKPLVFAVIPDITKDWAKELSKFNTVDISIVDKGPFNWEQEKDLGKQSSSGWSSIDTDPNFVIYYKNDALHLNVQNARRIQQIANASIAEIEDLMGRYPYPASLNGRKLPIYLASTPDEYSNTIDNLAGHACNSAGSIGMFVSHVGPLGFLADGIVLSPKCFNYESHPDNWAERVLRHEMNHFVFFSQLDYGKIQRHPLWVSEGLADYASLMHREQISSADSIEYIAGKCELLQQFPTEINAQYWAGRSFYKFMEEEKGGIGVRTFIQDLYSNPLEYALNETFNDSTDVKQLWVDNLRERLAPADSLLQN
jgi:hypothetical protein